MYVAYKKAGSGDLMKGFAEVCKLPYAEARKLVERPVAYIDCHDPKTMQLRVTRPGFLEGICNYMNFAKGIDNYDPNPMATRQEMRSVVYGQCHVGYYFRPEDKRLVSPRFQGLQADQILAYYDELGFKDWVHEETGGPCSKPSTPNSRDGIRGFTPGQGCLRGLSYALHAGRRDEDQRPSCAQSPAEH